MGRIVFKLERRSGQKDRNIPGVNIYYFNNLVTSEARPGQTRQFIVFDANEFEPGGRVGQCVHCDVCIRLEMLMLC